MWIAEVLIVQFEEHLSGEERTSCYPRVHTDAAAAGVVSSAGVVLLLEAVRASGVDVALSEGLQRWRKPTAVHDPEVPPGP